MVYGLWSMVYGLWSMFYGLWSMVYSLWFMIYGLWSMVYGLWSMVYGLWSMVYGLRIFNAACISVLLYGCESWILTAPIAKKLDIYARKCYRLMLGTKQSVARMTNDALYHYQQVE